MSYQFEEVRQEYLEGHLSLEEADKRLLGTRLNDQQAEEWSLIRSLDSGLRERANISADLPWLELSVTSRIEARHKAAEWLKTKGGVFGGIQSAAPVLFSPQAWKAVGAALIGGLTGYVVAANIPALSTYIAGLPTGSPLVFSCAALFSIASVLAVMSPNMTKYYK